VGVAKEVLVRDGEMANIVAAFVRRVIVVVVVVVVVAAAAILGRLELSATIRSTHRHQAVPPPPAVAVAVTVMGPHQVVVLKGKCKKNRSISQDN
jgi:hypothetical protein